MSEASFRERYPPPWRIEGIDGGFRIVSSNGFVLAYVYALDGIARSASPTSIGAREALAMAKAIAALGRLDGQN